MPKAPNIYQPWESSMRDTTTNNAPTFADLIERGELVKRHVYGVPVYVPPSDWDAIDEQILDKRDWIMAFHKEVYKTVTAIGVKGDPNWDELIRLTDHPKGRA